MQTKTNRRKRRRGCRAGRKVQECKKRRLEAIQLQSNFTQDNPASCVLDRVGQPPAIEPPNDPYCEPQGNADSNSPLQHTSDPEYEIETIDLVSDEESDRQTILSVPPPPIRDS